MLRKLYICISDETQAWEQQGYDVDVFCDEFDGRDENLSRVGLEKYQAESYVDSLKQEYQVEYVRWQ